MGTTDLAHSVSSTMSNLRRPGTPRAATLARAYNTRLHIDPAGPERLSAG
jgi:hypothetical protein